MIGTAALYRRHRFPGEIIAHAVWLYFRFALSYRDIEVLLAERGVQVSYETIGQWSRKFGPIFAEEIRRRRPAPRDKWHLDEVRLRINGKTGWLWRAVDQDGMVLDILVQERRNQEAAETFLRRLVARQPAAPRVVVTDRPASYAPALRNVLPKAEHRKHKSLNNRAENSHQPTRQRERGMRRVKSRAQAQRFLDPFGPIREHWSTFRCSSDLRIVHQTLNEIRQWFCDRSPTTPQRTGTLGDDDPSERGNLRASDPFGGELSELRPFGQPAGMSAQHPCRFGNTDQLIQRRQVEIGNEITSHRPSLLHAAFRHTSVIGVAALHHEV